MKSFFKFLSRNKLYTIIELFGLSFSLCFLILIFNFTDGELQRASSQPQSKNIYVAGMRDYIGMTYGTPDYLSSKIPEITEWCRWIPDLYIDCKIGDEWRMSEAAADPNFFDFFDFDFEGTSKDKAFESISSAVVSRSFAASAFEGESPVGKSLYMELSGVAQDVVITGVIEDFTDTFLKPVDIIINAKNKLCSSSISPMDHFGVVAPFFKVVSDTDIKELNDKMDAAYKEYWDYWGDGFVGPSKIYRMDEIYFSDSASSNFLHGDKGMLRILFAVCMVLLISAIMNYINMTSAQASKRAKEMATHRLLGASKETVIGKYISESIVFTAVSFAVGLLFAAALKTPVQKALSSDVTVNLSLFPDVRTVAAYIAIIVVVGILSGLIPAFLVSRFKPINVVKGEFRVKSKMVFSKVFISAQAFLAIVLCSLSISMFAQLKHLSNIPMGYNTTNLLEVNTSSMGGEYTLGLKQEIETLPMVSRVGLSKGMPYRVGAQIMPDKNGNDVTVRMLNLDSTAFNMFGFKMKEHYTKMNSPVVYYTEYAANTLGITENNPSPNAQVFSCFRHNGKFPYRHENGV